METRIRQRPRHAGRGNRRAAWHDYHAPCVYLVTLKKVSAAPRFCAVVGDYRHKDDAALGPRPAYSDTGRVVRDALRSISLLTPRARLLQYAVMPDHLHMVLHITERTDESLGDIIVAYKMEVRNRLRVADMACDIVFEEGFNDQILTPERSLGTVIRYVRDNPYRLAVRQSCPELFRHVTRLCIGGTDMEAYGNLELLYTPFKDAVVYHRGYSGVEWQRLLDRWEYLTANGGVLVSAAIHPAERDAIGDNASRGGAVIRICGEPFGERYAPRGEAFATCAAGQLLQLHPLGLPYQRTDGRMSRNLALRLNAIAEMVAVWRR